MSRKCRSGCKCRSGATYANVEVDVNVEVDFVDVNGRQYRDKGRGCKTTAREEQIKKRTEYCSNYT